jgi:anti-anti-sigma factor
MTFTATTQIDDAIATITLTGELDASSVPIFRDQIDAVAKASPSRDFMSSAGLRVLVFAKQKLGTEVDIYLAAAQELIVETLEKTGFDQSIIIVDSYDAAIA